MIDKAAIFLIPLQAAKITYRTNDTISAGNEIEPFRPKNMRNQAKMLERVCGKFQ
jgi:hypothetical protein